MRPLEKGFRFLAKGFCFLLSSLKNKTKQKLFQYKTVNYKPVTLSFF